jgi:ABC-2 type transport system permease protein
MGSAVRFTLRQVRRSGFIWAGVMFVLMLSSAYGYQNLYPDPRQRRVFAASIGSNSGFAAILGVPHRLDTTGGFLAWRLSVLLAVVLGLWAMLLTTRLLRGEEDSGRWEVLGAGAFTTSSLTCAVLVGVAIIVLLPPAAGLLGMLLAAPYAHVGVSGAILMMLGQILCAMAFAAVAAVASQLFAPRSRATLVSCGFLALAYLIRLLADSEPRLESLRWASPIGWLEQARIYDRNRVGVFLLFVAWIALCVGVTLWLAARRDVGAAVFGASTRVRARTLNLGNPFTDALRFTRASVIGWLSAVTFISFVLGLVAPSAAKTIADSGISKQLSEFFGGFRITTATYIGLTFVIVIASLIALGPSAHVASARDEEASGRLENVLAGRTSRRTWLWSRIAVAVLMAIVMALIGAAAGWVGQRVVGGDVGFVHLLAATAAYVPLAFLFGAVGVAVFGFAPRMTQGLIATLVGFAVLIELVGEILQAPSWLLDLSPFFHLGRAPGEPARLLPALLMLGLSVVLAIVGVERFVHRDLARE